MNTIKTTAEYDKWEADLRDIKALARVRVRIRRLSLGNPGKVRNLKAGVVELKIEYGPGYRVYYTERGGEIIILLCGGTKKRQEKDIALAEKLAKEI